MFNYDEKENNNLVKYKYKEKNLNAIIEKEKSNYYDINHILN